MAEAITIARPYAKAIFDIAIQKGELKAWSDLLAVFAQCSAEPKMQEIISSPSVSNEQVISLLTEVAGESMTGDAPNFLNMLAENNRLALLDEIANAFEELREESEKILTAEVVSAKALSDEQQSKISAALSTRLGREVTLDILIDETLLGGAIVRAGDLVIDGSAVGKLNRLASAIN